MYCLNCGKEINGKDRFCPYCGYENSHNDNIENNVQSEEKSEDVQAPKTEKSEEKTLGILSMVFAFIIPFVGLIVSICGLVNYKEKNNRSLCLAALIISGVVIILDFVVSILLMARIIAVANYHGSYFLLF